MATTPAEMAQAVTVDSAPTQEPIVTQATEADPTATTGSEPEQDDPTEATTPPANPDEEGSAPAESKKTPVKEIIHLRKRAQEAERKIAEEARQREQLERDLVYYRALSEGKVSQLGEKPVNSDQPQPPRMEDFEDSDGILDVDSYDAAVNEYNLSQVEARVLQKFTQQRSQEEQARRTQAQIEAYSAAVNEYAKTDPDIVEVFNDFNENMSILDHNNPMTPAIAASIISADPRVLKHLYENPDAINRIYKSGDIMRAGMELGMIAAEVRNKKAIPTQRVSAAPAPIEPIKPIGVIDVPLSEIEDTHVYRQRRLEQRRAAGVR